MEQTKDSKVVFAALLVLLVLAGGFIWFRSQSGDNDKAEVVNAPREGVEVTANDTTTSEGKKIPDGMPTDIPVDGDIVESYKAFYSEQGVTQYTVGIMSENAKGEVWDEYSSFLEENGYEIDEESSSKASGYISGNKEGDTLSVAISTIAGSTLVQLNLLDRN